MNVDLSGLDDFFSSLVMHGILWGRYLLVIGILWGIGEFAFGHNIKRGMSAVFCVIIGGICLLSARSWAGI